MGKAEGSWELKRPMRQHEHGGNSGMAQATGPGEYLVQAARYLSALPLPTLSLLQPP